MAILGSNPEAGMVCGPAEYWHSWTGDPQDGLGDVIEHLTLPPNSLVRPPAMLTVCYPLVKGTAPGVSSILLIRGYALDSRSPNI